MSIVGWAFLLLQKPAKIHALRKLPQLTEKLLRDFWIPQISIISMDRFEKCPPGPCWGMAGLKLEKRTPNDDHGAGLGQGCLCPLGQD